MALIVGGLMYALVMEFFNKLVWILLRCEALGAHDYSFLLDI